MKNENKLIAEFMGVDIIPLEQFEVGVQSRRMEGYLLEHLQYHTEWNWLMPVVLKCFEKEEEVKDDLIFKLNDALLEVNIESLYKVVVEFIKLKQE